MTQRSDAVTMITSTFPDLPAVRRASKDIRLMILGFVSNMPFSDELTTALAGVTAYIDGKMATILGGAGPAIDTLKELGDLLANDQTALSALTTGLSSKASQGALDALSLICNGHTTDINALKLWRTNAVIAAGANVATGTSVPTAVITLGLFSPTAVGLNAEFDAIKTQINTLKAAIKA